MQLGSLNQRTSCGEKKRFCKQKLFLVFHLIGDFHLGSFCLLFIDQYDINVNNFCTRIITTYIVSLVVIFWWVKIDIEGIF